MRAKPFIVRFFSGIFKPKNIVLGNEFAGVVSKVGADTTEFKVGDRVFGFDDEGFGGHAKFKKISAAKAVAIIPNEMSTKDAAIAVEGAHYALFYIDAMKLDQVDNAKVFVHGATGSIGSAAVQILKSKGVYVCASAPSEHLDTIRSLGADKVVDWTKDEHKTMKGGFYAVFDSVGKSSFADARSILSPGGVYMSSELGGWAQNPILALFNPIQRVFSGANIKFPIPRDSRQKVLEISKLIECNKFTPLFDREYSLDDIVHAYEYVEQGQKIGNVRLKIAD